MVADLEANKESLKVEKDSLQGDYCFLLSLELTV